MRIQELRQAYIPIKIVLENEEERTALLRILQEYLMRTVHLAEPLPEPFKFTRSIADKLFDGLSHR